MYFCPLLTTVVRNSLVFFILYYDQQTHNYFTNYHTATCFDTIMSYSGISQLVSCQVTQLCQMQQFGNTICNLKLFHIVCMLLNNQRLTFKRRNFFLNFSTPCI